MLELEEGGEPGSWLGSGSLQSRVPGLRVSQLQRSGPGRAARVAEARPGPPLTILPLPWCSAERSALYTARFESRLVFGVEQTGATLRAPQISQFFASLSVNKSVHL